MLKLHFAPNSRAGRIVWLLEELGLPYTLEEGTPRSEIVMAHNASGKIPVLLDGDVALTDSTAIMTYLADKHGALTYPAGSLDRARQDGWTQLVLDELDANVWTAARHSFVLPKEQRVAEVKDSLKWEFARSLAQISERLADQPFLMGEMMTVPDIILCHCLGWAHIAKYDAADARLQDYQNRLLARPAFSAVLS